MKKTYFENLKIEKDAESITSLPHGFRGRPLMLGDYDAEVVRYEQSFRKAGICLNWSIFISAAKGIVSYWNPLLLIEHSGSIDIEWKWAESFLSRYGYVN